MKGDVALHLGVSDQGKFSIAAFVIELDSQEEALEMGEVIKDAVRRRLESFEGPLSDSRPPHLNS